MHTSWTQHILFVSITTIKTKTHLSKSTSKRVSSNGTFTLAHMVEAACASEGTLPAVATAMEAAAAADAD
jgi:hypothetical protein